MNRILTINAGSSTVKFGVFEAAGDRAVHPLARGVLDLHASPLALHFEMDGQRVTVQLDAAGTDDRADDRVDDRAEAIGAALSWLEARFDGCAFAAAAHRIVHGGIEFDAPTVLDDTIIERLDRLSPLAPLHQPIVLQLVRAMRRARPDQPQIACFDTAFHRSHAPLVTRMAIPRWLHDEGVRRYGFHGLSYRSVADQLRHDEPELLAKKIVVAHLGSGASLCAMEAGISRDTSMGFSALDGIPMATRPGELDAGVLLYLQRQHGMTAEQLQHWLYHECGLKGVSGISADLRVLLASPAPEAAEAIALFCFRISRSICALAATLGGLDGIVFTAGIGEHAPSIRAAVCEQLSWLGAKIDPHANARNDRMLDAGDGIALRMIRTDEEQVIAESAAALLLRGA